MQPSTDDATVELSLSSSEALVLFELLSRWTADAERPRPSPKMFETAAEPIALNQLLGHLEKELSAPFAPDYPAMLEHARKNLVSMGGDDFAL